MSVERDDIIMLDDLLTGRITYTSKKLFSPSVSYFSFVCKAENDEDTVMKNFNDVILCYN